MEKQRSQNRGFGAETERKTMHTVAVREVRAVYRRARKATHRIREAAHAAAFIRKVLPDNSREHFVALYLDGAHKVIGYSVIATGTANACPVHPREIFQIAVLQGAVAFLVGHNHPSGDLTPSTGDASVTRQLKEAGTLLAIKLLDHVIVTDVACYSFAEDGKL